MAISGLVEVGVVSALIAVAPTESGDVPEAVSTASAGVPTNVLSGAADGAAWLSVSADAEIGADEAGADEAGVEEDRADVSLSSLVDESVVTGTVAGAVPSEVVPGDTVPSVLVEDLMPESVVPSPEFDVSLEEGEFPESAGPSMVAGAVLKLPVSAGTEDGMPSPVTA